MKNKHDFYTFPSIFEKITDFQVSIASKRVRVPPFFLEHSDADEYERSHAKLQINYYKDKFCPIFSLEL